MLKFLLFALLRTIFKSLFAPLNSPILLLATVDYPVSFFVGYKRSLMLVWTLKRRTYYLAIDNSSISATTIAPFNIDGSVWSLWLGYVHKR